MFAGHGLLAQLGERLGHNQNVSGSSPLQTTISVKTDDLQKLQVICFFILFFNFTKSLFLAETLFPIFMHDAVSFSVEKNEKPQEERKSEQMIHVLNTIRKTERKIDSCAEQFVWRHPAIGILLIFIGTPLFVLLCVCLGTILLTFPIALLFG